MQKLSALRLPPLHSALSPSPSIPGPIIRESSTSIMTNTSLHPHRLSVLQASDPRSTSSQSLVPSRTEDDDRGVRRRLLVVYIHGFIGNDDSFHSFPYHVHIALKEKIAATHVVHSKIYPRYKTYKAFHLARDNFSEWLSVHETPDTDVILVGHSMGGLLAADVVLMVICRIPSLIYYKLTSITAKQTNAWCPQAPHTRHSQHGRPLPRSTKPSLPSRSLESLPINTRRLSHIPRQRLNLDTKLPTIIQHALTKTSSFSRLPANIIIPIKL